MDYRYIVSIWALLLPLVLQAQFPPFNNLVLWLKADAGISVADGQPVPVWQDQSGNGYHATATGAQQPTFIANLVAGKSGVQFNGTTNIMSLPAINLTGTDKAVLFIYYRVTGSTTPGSAMCVFENSTDFNSSTTGFALFDMDQIGTVQLNGITMASRGNNGYTMFETTESATGFRLVNLLLDRSFSSNEIFAGYCGGATGDRTAGNANNTNFLGNNPSYIGARFGSVLPMEGEILEILLYSLPLSALDQAIINNYLFIKYNNFCIVLAPAWVDFRVESLNQDAHLFWQIDQANIGSHFMVERSNDGSSFSVVSRDPIYFGQDKTRPYHYIDQNLSPGVYYYRIRHKEFDGSLSYSDVRKINIDEGSYLRISHQENSTSWIVHSFEKPRQIVLTDYVGRQILRFDHPSHNQLLNLESQAAGLYWVIVNLNNGRQKALRIHKY